MVANLLPSEATHKSLDLFEKPSLLVTLDGSFGQNWDQSTIQMGPCYNLKSAVTEIILLTHRKFSWK